MKKCFKCGIEKPLTEFYKHKKMSDGHINKCKDCSKKDVKDYYEKNIERYTQYEISRRDNPERLKARREHSKWLRENDPERYKLYQSKYNSKKRKAVITSGNAIRDKKLKKEPCKICGELKVQAHHYDYEKPLDVIWLCKKHHMEAHRKYGTLNVIDDIK